MKKYIMLLAGLNTIEYDLFIIR